MHAILHGWAELFRSLRGAIFPAIVGAIPHDAELAQAFREGVIGWRKGDTVEPDFVDRVLHEVPLPFVRQPVNDSGPKRPVAATRAAGPRR